MPTTRASLTQKTVSVADFQTLPDNPISVKRMADNVSLSNADELRVVLESFPPRPLEWNFLFWQSDLIEFTGSSHYETSSGPGTTTAFDEYRFIAHIPPDSTFTMQQMLRFMYASTIAPLADALLYEIDVTLLPSK